MSGAASFCSLPEEMQSDRNRRIGPRYVMGNHEYYDADYERVLERARKEADELGIHLLENDQAVIDGVCFLGATLWTAGTRAAAGRPVDPRSLNQFIAAAAAEKVGSLRTARDFLRERAGSAKPKDMQNRHSHLTE